jgi:8-oxo-dGTP diphosphatase
LINLRPSIVIIENGKILCLKYVYNGTLVYNLPGGNLEFGENIREALRRELLEELNVEVEVLKLIFVGEVHQNKMVKMHFIFEGRIEKGFPKINPLQTSAIEASWLEMNNLKNINLYPNVNENLINWHYKLANDSVYLGEIVQKWF